jgi:hypothetical protein
MNLVFIEVVNSCDPAKKATELSENWVSLSSFKFKIIRVRVNHHGHWHILSITMLVLLVVRCFGSNKKFCEFMLNWFCRRVKSPFRKQALKFWFQEFCTIIWRVSSHAISPQFIFMAPGWWQYNVLCFRELCVLCFTNLLTYLFFSCRCTGRCAASFSPHPFSRPFVNGIPQVSIFSTSKGCALLSGHQRLVCNVLQCLLLHN